MQSKFEYINLEQEISKSDFNFPGNQLEEINDLIESKVSGLIIVTGVTGSGKSMTTEKLFNYFSKKYPNKKFIYIGELRDINSVSSINEIIKIENTFIFSSMHSSESMCLSIKRLEELSFDFNFLNKINSSFIFILNQTLKDLLCHHCSIKLNEKYIKDKNIDNLVLEKLSYLGSFVKTLNFKVKNQYGCFYCQNGVKRKIAILNYTNLDAKVFNLIIDKKHKEIESLLDNNLDYGENKLNNKTKNKIHLLCNGLLPIDEMSFNDIKDIKELYTMKIKFELKNKLKIKIGKKELLKI